MRLGGRIARVFAAAMRPVISPPAVMCVTTCFTVLALADYRVGEEALNAAMRPPEPTAELVALRLSQPTAELTALPTPCLDAPTDPEPAKDSKPQTTKARTEILRDTLARLSLRVAPSELLVPREDDGGWTVMHAALPLERRVRVASGQITSTFALAALEAGVPEAVIVQLTDVLGWELDFNKDLPAGARFRVAYEEIVKHGESASTRLLAAELQAGGKWHEAYYFAGRGHRGGYFDGDGRAIERSFLRYPVAFTRISSAFTARRFHPVLRIHRPHYGVDFAAPIGTPIRAVASGVITKAGWYGSSGRFVKLRHDARHETAYAHLSRIAPGIQPGVYVKKGETIGYVGQTGLATGPHLHFAMYVDGRYADPLRADYPRANSLHGRRLTAFREGLPGVNRMLVAADRIPGDEPLVTAAAY